MDMESLCLVSSCLMSRCPDMVSLNMVSASVLVPLRITIMPNGSAVSASFRYAHNNQRQQYQCPSDLRRALSWEVFSHRNDINRYNQRWGVMVSRRVFSTYKAVPTQQLLFTP